MAPEEGGGEGGALEGYRGVARTGEEEDVWKVNIDWIFFSAF